MPPAGWRACPHPQRPDRLGGQPPGQRDQLVAQPLGSPGPRRWSRAALHWTRSARTSQAGCRSATPSQAENRTVHVAPMCRDRAGARAPVAEGFHHHPFRAFVVWDHSSAWVTFPRAPLRSRTVGFPESGSDLGFPPEVFPTRTWLKRWHASTPVRGGLLPGSSQLRGSANPGSVSGAVLGPPSAQSLFAQLGCYLRRGGVVHHLEGHYPFFVARTGSCAGPTPSRLLRSSLGRRIFAGCCQPLLGDGPSRRFLCVPFLGCPDSYPGSPNGALVHFFPFGIGLPHLLTRGSATAKLRSKQLHTDPDFGAIVIRILRASKSARHPDCPHSHDKRGAAVASTSGQNACRCLHAHRICWPFDLDNERHGDLHPTRYAA